MRWLRDIFRPIGDETEAEKARSAQVDRSIARLNRATNALREAAEDAVRTLDTNGKKGGPGHG